MYMGGPIRPSDELCAGMVDARGERCHACNAMAEDQCSGCAKEICYDCEAECADCGGLIGCAECAVRRGGEKRGANWYCDGCPLPENVLTEEVML